MINLLKNQIIPGALSVLPEQMDSPAARAMLAAIALQESSVKYRKQINGPARSLWQFEQVGIEGVRKHPRTAYHYQNLLSNLLYDEGLEVYDVWKIIEHNDILACGIARLNLWTLPKKLPRANEADLAWAQYNAIWRPGKPHFTPWKTNFEKGWATI